MVSQSAAMNTPIPSQSISQAPTATQSHADLEAAQAAHEKRALEMHELIPPSKAPSVAGGDDSDGGAAGYHGEKPAVTPAGASQGMLGRRSTARSSIAGYNNDVVARADTREDGHAYPQGLKLVLITAALSLAVFLVALDNAIIATAIPKITDQFHSLPDVGWYGSAYLLTTAALQLLFGRFYTFFSIKWIFLIAIGLFELGSLICGVAPSSIVLIIGRAVAGVGSAGIFSGALIILAHAVPLAKRPMYGGLIGSMYGIASVSGPLLGGVFADKATWRWCFYINLPIGAFTVGAIALFFPDPKRQAVAKESWATRFKQFDPVGTMLFMPAVICLLLALQWGGTKYEWRNGRIIALLVVAAVLLAAFVVVQGIVGDNATVAPRIFFRRSVWSSSLFIFFTGAAFLTSIYFLPIWFQVVKHASAVRSGIMNLPMLIAVVICSIVSGILVTAFGYYTPFMLISSVLMAIGYGLITTFQPNISSAKWIGYQIIAGAGVGLGIQQPLMAVQAVLEIRDVPTGTALIAFMQTLGGALFVSVGQNIFSNGLVKHVTEMAPGVDPHLVLGTGATSIQDVIPPQFVGPVVQAYSKALTETFTVSAATAAIGVLGAVFVEWKSLKGKKVEMIGGA